MAGAWYYARDGEQRGPIGLDELTEMARTGRLRPTDPVWTESMPEWAPARDVPELGLAPAVEPTGPVAPPAGGVIADPQGTPIQALSYQAPPITEAASPRAIDLLRQTRPWVRLFAILTFLGTGLMLLAGVIGLVAVGVGGGRTTPNTWAMLVYIPFALLYFFPALFLWRYASRIAELEALRGTHQLERALEAQKSFWKFVGVLTVVVLGLYVLALVVMLVVVIFA
jgi:hypothetical protein